MKKTLFTIAAALALLCLAEQPSGSYLTWLGNNAGKDATANQSEFVGALSGQNAHDIYRSSFLGVMSGYNAFGIYNCFAAGIGALANATNVSGSVFIGPYAGRGARDVSGRTDINGQFFSDKGRDEFRIVTDPAKPVPVHYKGGILREQTDFAIRTDDADRAAWERANAHVWLSSFDGDDANSGLSPTGAVKTIAGAYNAAYCAVTNGTLNASNEIVVAVAEGVYAPVELYSSLTNGIAFVATGDRGDTILDGASGAIRGGAGGTNDTPMRCSSGFPFTIDGWTVTRFNRKLRASYNNWQYAMTDGIKFKRCDIAGNHSKVHMAWLAGEFEDCDIHGNRLSCAVEGQAASAAFGGWGGDKQGARLTRCHVWDNDFSPCEYLIYSSVSYADHCLFEVDFFEKYGSPGGGHNTIIAKTVSNPHVTGGAHAYNAVIGTNSFIVVASPGIGYDESIYNPTGSCCVVSNANLTADFVAADASCPSVRSGDLPDYGYRNSGFRHEADPTVPEWAKAESAPTYTAADVGAVSTNGGAVSVNGDANRRLLLGKVGLVPLGGSFERKGQGRAAFVVMLEDGTDRECSLYLDDDGKTYINTAGGWVRVPDAPNGGTLALASDIPTSMAWGSITGKPTTLSGYGITDALSSGGVSNIVTQAFVRDRLGVYLYVGEDGGIYVHTGD